MTTVRPRARILGIILIAALLAVACYYVVAWPRSAGLARPGQAMLLGALEKNGFDGLERGGRVTPLGLSADPLNQALVNSLVVDQALQWRDVRASVDGVDVLGSLGWRNTMAVQNIIWAAAGRRDMDAVIDGFDALMRRNQLLGPSFELVDLMATDPSLRPVLARRLAAAAPWRLNYLLTGGTLKTPATIEGRFELMRRVQRAGDPLTRNEIAPFLPVLIASGRRDRAFELWRAHKPGATSPLADADFAVAAMPGRIGELPIPFEWVLNSGPGFYANAARDGRGSYASFNWDGRGSPILATQLTSGGPGRYTLSVRGDDVAAIRSFLAFRLVDADGTAVPFSTGQSTVAGELLLITDQPVTRAFPQLEIIARPPSTRAGPGLNRPDLIIRRLSLRRLE